MVGWTFGCRIIKRNCGFRGSVISYKQIFDWMKGQCPWPTLCSRVNYVGFLNDKDVQNGGPFHYKISEFFFVNIAKSFIKKLLSIGNISTLNTSFPKFQFSFERLNIIFVVNLINCFSWSDGFTLLLCLLVRKCLAGKPCMKNSHLSVSWHFRWKCFCMKKSMQAFFLTTTIIFQQVADMLYIYFPFIKQIVKKTCTYMIKI